MADKIDNGLWVLILIATIVVVLYLWAVVAAANKTNTSATEVRVEHLREPLTAALNFVGILLALLAATAAYATAMGAEGTANWFAISAGSTVLAGLIIVWFLLGLPNMAGASETIKYRFPDYWDVLVVPNLVKLLIVIALTSYAGYLFFELHHK